MINKKQNKVQLTIEVEEEVQGKVIAALSKIRGTSVKEDGGVTSACSEAHKFVNGVTTICLCRNSNCNNAYDLIPLNCIAKTPIVHEVLRNPVKHLHHQGQIR